MAEKIKLITVCSEPTHAQGLMTSAHKHGWDIACLHVEWKGFGVKLLATYQLLKDNPEIERFIFCDAYDVIVMGNEAEFESKLQGNENIIMSAEKGLWPPTLIPFRCKYGQHAHGFNYINSGCYYATSKHFIKLIEKYPPEPATDDQFWFHMVFLCEPWSADNCVDNFQQFFNSHSFIADGEYGYENNRIQILGNEPVFIHSNGRNIDEKLNELII